MITSILIGLGSFFLNLILIMITAVPAGLGLGIGITLSKKFIAFINKVSKPIDPFAQMERS